MDCFDRTVLGVGFRGDGEFRKATHKEAYERWRAMLRRCYDKKFQEKNKSYIGCVVCDEWHNFQVFAKWYYKNKIDGFDLDKDIKAGGRGKIYSPETCTFVTRRENVSASIKGGCRTYYLIDPSGEPVTVFNLNKFAKSRGLCRKHLNKVANGNRKSHKGWTKQQINSGE